MASRWLAGQLGHLPGQLAAEVLPLGLVGRVGLAASQRGQIGLAVARLPLPQADQVERLVAANPKEPGGLAAAMKFLRRTLAKLQEGMLHRLPGGISIAQKPGRIAHQRRLIAIQDRKHPLPSKYPDWP